MTQVLLDPFPHDLLVLDLETTGPDPLRHSTVEIGAVLLDRRSLEELKAWSTLIKPPRATEIDDDAMMFHGHRIEELSNAKEPREAISEFVNRFGKAYILAGWNITFDVQFFRALLRLAGLIRVFDEIDYHRLDVWSVAQFLKSSGCFNGDVSSLSSVCQQLRLSRSEFHTGLQDARLTAAVLRHLVECSRQKRTA